MHDSDFLAFATRSRSATNSAICSGVGSACNSNSDRFKRSQRLATSSSDQPATMSGEVLPV